MKHTFPTARALATGAALGAIVLGLGGRFATAGLAVLLGAPTNLSAVGLAEAMIVGALWGTLGALVLPAEPAGRLRGVLTGIVTFAGTVVFAWVLGRAPDLGRLEGRATTVTAATVFLLFGLALGRAIPPRRPR